MTALLLVATTSNLIRSFRKRAFYNKDKYGKIAICICQQFMVECRTRNSCHAMS